MFDHPPPAGEPDGPYAHFDPAPGEGTVRRSDELVCRFAAFAETLAAMQREEEHLRMVDRYGMPYRSLRPAVRDVLRGPAEVALLTGPGGGERPRLTVASCGSHLAAVSLIPVTYRPWSGL